ncbi:MAG TPA: putative glycoside hydrolase [Gemmatimonadaceae bacterium]|nr:putative glycoside hydrolase [Gemmatimonadaceae bacterium]
MRWTPAIILVLAACTRGEAARSDSANGAMNDSASAASSGAASTPAPSADASAGFAAGTHLKDAPATVRALYVNRWATQSRAKMRHLIDIADQTEINGLVLDLKDEFGLNYGSRDTSVSKNAGRSGTIPGLPALIDTLHAHGIVVVARMVTFKDSVAARVNPQHTIRKTDGSAWRDKQGLTWVDPYDPMIREYNIRVAEELARMGFDEIQFDYVRFPEPYPSLPQQVFPDAKGISKPQALADFLGAACKRINASGARCTADIFGLVTTVRGPLEIGQEWEKISPPVDVVLPMTYPSHYPRGSFGVARPNAEPEKIQRVAISKAHDRDLALKITKPEHVRPWVQAFTLGAPPYGPAEIEAQKRGIYAAGYDGWVLWSPGSKYDIFLPALEKELVARKQPYPSNNAATPAVANSTPKAAADSVVDKVKVAAPGDSTHRSPR